MSAGLLLEILSAVLVVAGAGFFTVGTVGLVRLPDLRTRLHALTKADNLGLGLVVLGLVLQAGSVGAAVKLLVVWFLAMPASAVVAHLMSRGGGLGATGGAAEGPGTPGEGGAGGR